jgi:uncharacterized protein YdeI (YjbR/CyaY-like superfamily)
MNKVKTLYLSTRTEWHKWLTENFEKEKEIWLVYPKKSSGKKRIQYNDAVEEALCFGWIDSTNKSLDKDNTIQKFTPRNLKSRYSKANIEKLKWLLKENMIHTSISKTILEIINEKFVMPSDIINEIKKDKIAWKNYKKFSDPYKRIRVGYINSARKRPEEFKKRLLNFICKTHDNKLIRGFGGIEKYY